MRGNAQGDPLPGIVEAVHAGDGVAITTFYKGQPTYHQCVLHKDCPRLKESPKLALSTGCWAEIPDEEPEAVGTSAPATAKVSPPTPAKSETPSVAEIVARNKLLKNASTST